MNQQSGYNINDLVREAQTRWLKPAEVLFILQNHENHQITNEPAQKPPSGSLFLFNKRVLRFFRKDGHSWRRKKDGRTVGEAHERLKVGNVEAINCYYAHGEQNPNFQRRSYWMLDPAYEHIVLVHYRDINEGRQDTGLNVSQSSQVSATFSPSPSSYSTRQISIGEFYEPYKNLSSPGSAEISSDVSIRSNGVNHSDNVGRTEEVNSSSGLEMSQALRRLELQLSLDDESVQEIGPFYSESENSSEFGSVVWDQGSSAGMQLNPNSLQLQHHSGDEVDNRQLLRHEANMWKEMLDSFDGPQNVELHAEFVDKLDENGMLLGASRKENVEEYEHYTVPDFEGKGALTGTSIPQQVEEFSYLPYPPAISTYGTNPGDYSTVFDQAHTGSPIEDGLSLTIAQKQKFTIQEISPEWGYASETTKVLIIGYFLCDPLESVWTCMFGDVEAPVQIVQEGVMRCLAPPHLPGKVTLCITSGNRESCSEVREFEYRDKPMADTHSNLPETDSMSREELLLLVRFVQTLLCNTKLQKGDSAETGIDLVSKSRAGDDSWSQVIEALLVGTWTSATTTDWLLQELLKDKLQQWLYSRSQEESDQVGCSLSKKEQGIIHVIAGLGFEWALHPILKSGVSVNFRDINGWTGLHWAARFGREKMVAALMASGASAGAVTDPNSQDPVGKTPASIAATYGHNGLAGYLSEKALTSHLSSLTLEESELSKGSANLEAERTINSVSRASHITNEDQVSLKDTLAAVRNAAQAAARIQSAFRAHSFRKRQQKEAAASAAVASSSQDEYGVISDDVISAASKLAFRNSRDYNSAALSIQKKYRGWKGRKDFLTFRQKVVKIQAHIRGYQVRRQYRVCWAVGILEKVVLRWRRRGVGLRGFRQETESIGDETDDEDILKVFRKQKVDAALDEAVNRVLLMVDCPEARKQYHRILEKYRQAKAELEGVENENTQASNDDLSYMENDGNYQFT